MEHVNLSNGIKMLILAIVRIKEAKTNVSGVYSTRSKSDTAILTRRKTTLTRRAQEKQRS